MYVHNLYLHDAFYRAPLLLTGRACATFSRPGLQQPPSSGAPFEASSDQESIFFPAPRGGLAARCVSPRVFASPYLISCPRCSHPQTSSGVLLHRLLFVSLYHTLLFFRKFYDIYKYIYKYIYIHHVQRRASRGLFLGLPKARRHSTRHLCAARPITFEDFYFVPPFGELGSSVGRSAVRARKTGG